MTSNPSDNNERSDKDVTEVTNPEDSHENQVNLSDVHYNCVLKQQALQSKLTDQETTISDLMKELDRLRSLLSSKEHGVHQRVILPNITTASQSVLSFRPSTCHIIGDSHMRGISTFLQPLLPKEMKTNSFFQPGAGLKEIADAQENSPNLMIPIPGDDVIICGGTADVCSTQWDLIQRAIDSLLHKFKDCSRLIYIGIPRQYKVKKLNYHITRLNTKLKNYLISKSNYTIFIDPNRFLKAFHYTRDGVHLNKQGKSIVCNKLKNILLSSPNSSHDSIPTIVKGCTLDHSNTVIKDYTRVNSITPLPSSSHMCSNLNLSLLPKSKSKSSPICLNPAFNAEDSLFSDESCLYSSPMTGDTPMVSNYSGMLNPIPVLANTPVIKRTSRKNFIKMGPTSII